MQTNSPMRIVNCKTTGQCKSTNGAGINRRLVVMTVSSVYLTYIYIYNNLWQHMTWLIDGTVITYGSNICVHKTLSCTLKYSNVSTENKLEGGDVFF